MSEVVQYIGRREIIRRCNAVGAPRATLCRCAGISDAMLSLVLIGDRRLSEKAQLAIMDTLRFFEELQADHEPVPVHFSDSEAIFRLYRDWKAKNEADVVVGTEAEEAEVK